MPKTKSSIPATAAPRVNKTKEQIDAELKAKAEVARKRIIVKDYLYPLLLKNSDSVDGANLYIQAIAMGIKQAFNNTVATTKVEALGLDKMIDTKQDKYQEYLDLLSLVKGESVKDALEILEGMIGQISHTLANENKTRKFKDLKIDLL